MIQSIMILTFLVSAGAWAAKHPNKINEQQTSRTVAPLLKNPATLPWVRPSTMKYLHLTRDNQRQTRFIVFPLGKVVNDCKHLLIFLSCFIFIATDCASISPAIAHSSELEQR